MPLTERLRATRRRVVKESGRSLLKSLGRFFANQSLIGDHPSFDKSVFPFTADFEANWQTIRAELEQVLERGHALPSFHQVSRDQERISKEQSWKTFVFYAFGARVDANCKRCPETARMLDALPGIKNGWFSILSPHYHIPAHKGPTRGVVRIHLGLVVPGERDKCRLRVDNEILHWDEGKCIVFDDHYDHEVWNDTDDMRAVLFFDVDRPMRPLGRFVNRIMNAAILRSAYIQDALKNLEDWERKHGDNNDRDDHTNTPRSRAA